MVIRSSQRPCPRVSTRFLDQTNDIEPVVAWLWWGRFSATVQWWYSSVDFGSSLPATALTPRRLHLHSRLRLASTRRQIWVRYAIFDCTWTTETSPPTHKTLFEGHQSKDTQDRLYLSTQTLSSTTLVFLQSEAATMKIFLRNSAHRTCQYVSQAIFLLVSPVLLLLPHNSAM